MKLYMKHICKYIWVCMCVRNEQCAYSYLCVYFLLHIELSYIKIVILYYITLYIILHCIL